MHQRKLRNTLAVLFCFGAVAIQAASQTAKPPAQPVPTVPPVKPPAVASLPVAAPSTEPAVAIYALAFSPDGKHLAVGTHREALLYDAATWGISETCTQIDNSVRSFAFHPDGKHLAVGSGSTAVSGSLLMWDMADPTHNVNYEAAGDTIESIALSKDGTEMLTASFDSKARLFPNTFYPYSPQKLEEHNGRVTCVAFSQKLKTIFVTGAMDKMVKVWDRKTSKVVVNFDQATAGITGAAFLANGDQIVGSSMDGNLYWWGVSYNERKNQYSGYSYRTIKAHEDGITAFSESANMQRLVTGGSDHRVCVWRADDGGLVREFKQPTAAVYCTALSPDGKLAAAAGREGVVWVWDVEANKLLTSLTPPHATLPSAAVKTVVIKLPLTSHSVAPKKPILVK